MGYVTYYKRDNKWLRKEWKSQCEKELFIDKCQGTSGHSGDHWHYQPDGSLVKSNPDGGLAIIPPGHKTYVSPVKMQKYHHIKFSTMTPVKDKKIIEMLEKDKTPEGDASIDRPVELE